MEVPSRSPFQRFLRIAAGAAAVLFAAPLVVALSNSVRSGVIDPLTMVVLGFLAVVITLCAWFALRGALPQALARMRVALLGGMIVGGIGFAGGFFGPILLAPEANQGPLLGIFFTGPLRDQTSREFAHPIQML
jgi:hypothetical protein